jgi:hypothetical protein
MKQMQSSQLNMIHLKQVFFVLINIINNKLLLPSTTNLPSENSVIECALILTHSPYLNCKEKRTQKRKKKHNSKIQRRQFP